MSGARFDRNAVEPPATTPRTLEEVHERYIRQIEKKVPMGSSKVRSAWDILKDRKSHTVESIATELGYGNVISFKNTKILKIMDAMGILDMIGKSAKMNDKAFPSNLADKDIVVL